MTPQTFFGATSREVLRKVRQTLGDDALIVSNSSVADGVQVTALAARALETHLEPPPQQIPRERQIEREFGARREPQLKLEPAIADAGLVGQLMKEVSALKTTLQRELSAIAWSDMRHRAPARARIVQSLLKAGFSASLTREIASLVAADATHAAASHAVTSELSGRMELAEADQLVEAGGIYALVGPTGAGKTTTVAKLAARCVVRRGAGSLALLTTDSYRIGAHDQLRIYGRILGVSVHAVKDAADMKATLSELKNKHTVLIDTTGMSQRDRMLAEQNSVLAAGDQIKRVLLLNATSSSATLDEVIDCYTQQAVCGCIMTKIDESASMGTIVDCIIRHGLALHYVTNGQRVPEDVHLPNRAYLLHRALRTMPNEATTLDAEQMSFLLADEQEAGHV